MAGRERLYGFHPVREALRAQRRELGRLFVRVPVRGGVEELVAHARTLGLEVEEVDAETLSRLAPPGVRTQGLLLEAGRLPTSSLESLAAAEASPLVALDGVEDPQNLGAILRVADAAGAKGLFLTQRRAPPLSPSVARASAGALEHLPVCRVANLAAALDLLKKEGYWVFGADAREGDDWFEVPNRLLAGRQVFLFGAEGRGIRPAVSRRIDHWIRIPLGGKVESLNVAMAAAVILFELARRQRS